MEIIVEYRNKDLTSGTCTRCQEYSKEIIKVDGRCVDCFEEENFINKTLKNKNYE
ncbi:MAG: hypothetical protein ACOC1O_00605 [bacterium]